MYKPCPRCHKVKPAVAFYRDSSRADGLSYYCRECSRSLMGRDEPAGAPASRIPDRELMAEASRRGLIGKGRSTVPHE